MRYLVSVFFILSLAFPALARNAKMELLHPRGGEVFEPGEEQKILINRKRVIKRLTVEFSSDGGVTFETLQTLDATTIRETRHVFTFVVPDKVTPQGIIRVTGENKRGTKRIQLSSGEFGIGTSPHKFAVPMPPDSENFILITDGKGGAVWVHISTITNELKGPKGDPGEKGDKGDTGDSGVEEADIKKAILYVLKHYPNLCKGPKGDKGEKGEDGKCECKKKCKDHSWNGEGVGHDNHDHCDDDD